MIDDTKNDVLNVLKGLEHDMFLVDYPYQKEVYYVDFTENQSKSSYDIRIKTTFNNCDKDLFIRCFYDTLECGVMFPDMYDNDEIKHDVYVCAKRLETLLKKVLIDENYVKINGRFC